MNSPEGRIAEYKRSQSHEHTNINIADGVYEIRAHLLFINCKHKPLPTAQRSSFRFLSVCFMKDFIGYLSPESFVFLLSSANVSDFMV